MSAHHWIRPKTRTRILSGDPPPWLVRHPRRDYVTRVIVATPPWVDRVAMREKTEVRSFLTHSTGRVHVVDHIIPLCHPYVCGLNVPWNLAVVLSTFNARKGNGFTDQQLDLFDLPQ